MPKFPSYRNQSSGFANQLKGFYVMTNLAFNELNKPAAFSVANSSAYRVLKA